MVIVHTLRMQQRKLWCDDINHVTFADGYIRTPMGQTVSHHRAVCVLWVQAAKTFMCTLCLPVFVHCPSFPVTIEVFLRRSSAMCAAFH